MRTRLRQPGVLEAMNELEGKCRYRGDWLVYIIDDALVDNKDKEFNICTFSVEFTGIYLQSRAPNVEV